MNVIVLIGNITADLQLRRTNNAISYVQFNIAVRRPTADNQADFIKCVAWQKTAENIAKYFRKGQKIAIRGSLNVNEYLDSNNQKKYDYTVRVDEFDFVESKNSNNQVSPNSFNNLPQNNQDPSVSNPSNMPYSNELGF